MPDLISMLVAPTADLQELPQLARPTKQNRSHTRNEPTRKRQEVTRADDPKRDRPRTTASDSRPEEFEAVLRQVETKPKADPQQESRATPDSSEGESQPSLALPEEERPAEELTALAWMLGNQEGQVSGQGNQHSEAATTDLLANDSQLLPEQAHLLPGVKEADLEVVATAETGLGEEVPTGEGEQTQTEHALLKPGGDEEEIGFEETSIENELAGDQHDKTLINGEGREARLPQLQNVASTQQQLERAKGEEIAGELLEEGEGQTEETSRISQDDVNSGNADLLSQGDNDLAEEWSQEDAQPNTDDALTFRSILSHGETGAEGTTDPSGSVADVAGRENAAFSAATQRINDSVTSIRPGAAKPTGETRLQVDQMEQAFRTQLQQRVRPAIESARWGQSEVHIELDPPELGTLRVSIQRGVQGVQIAIQTDNASSQQLLENSLRDLVDSLEQAGVDLQDVNVSQGFERQQRDDSDPNTATHGVTAQTNEAESGEASGDTFDGEGTRPIDSSRVDLVA